MLREESVTVRGWLPVFDSHFHVPGALTTMTVPLGQLSKSRPELRINKQFCRDVSRRLRGLGFRV